MQLPAISALKKEHPNWRITLWVAPRGTRELAQAQPYIDEVIEMPIRSGAIQHLKNIFLLRKKSFSIGIVLSPGQLLKSAAYLFFAGIPVRIGNLYPFRKNTDSSFFLTNAIPEKSSLHDIEQNIALLSPICKTLPTIDHYQIYIPDQNKKGADTLLSKKYTYIGIHAGSAKGFEWKRWPIDRFASVAQQLFLQNSTRRFGIFGSHNEQYGKQQLVEEINNACGATVAFNITAPLMTTAAAIQKCSLFISNDSGLMHIASAVGTPTIGLFGPTDERHTGPRGINSMVVRAPDTKPIYNTEKIHSLGKEPHASMLAISPEMVLSAVDSLYNTLV